MVRDVDLELHKGEILGIAGLEGFGQDGAPGNAVWMLPGGKWGKLR